MTGRTQPEWIGATPNSAPPPRVKQRILDRYDWKCRLTKIDLRPLAGQIDFDHVKALVNGGENRESNLAPIWRPKHREKTAQDVAEKSAVAEIIKHHYGLESPKRAIPQRTKPAKAPRDKLPLPMRRSIYVEAS